MKTENYVRKPFHVEAVRVTPENMDEVAEWCGGKVRDSMPEGLPDRSNEKHIKVKVQDARNDRQSKAFVGDWVLKSVTGFKVYTPYAFEKNFIKPEVGQSTSDVVSSNTIVGNVLSVDSIRASVILPGEIRAENLATHEITEPLDFIGLVGEELGGKVVEVTDTYAVEGVGPLFDVSEDQCPEVEFHTSYLSGFYDPNGHHIKESRFVEIYNLQNESPDVRAAMKEIQAAKHTQ